jgi:hypothetical protein
MEIGHSTSRLHHSDPGRRQSVNEDEAGISSSVPTDHVYAVLKREDTSASLQHGPADHNYAVLEEQEVPAMANKHSTIGPDNISETNTDMDNKFNSESQVDKDVQNRGTAMHQRLGDQLYTQVN